MPLDWKTVRARLEAQRLEIAGEIRAYPAPITACDAQFNHLTEQRRLLTRELARLDAAAEAPDASVEDFVRTSALIGDAGMTVTFP